MKPDTERHDDDLRETEKTDPSLGSNQEGSSPISEEEDSCTPMSPELLVDSGQGGASMGEHDDPEDPTDLGRSEAQKPEHRASDAPIDPEQLPNFKGPEDFEYPGRRTIEDIKEKLRSTNKRVLFLMSDDDKVAQGSVAYVARHMESDGWIFKSLDRPEGDLDHMESDGWIFIKPPESQVRNQDRPKLPDNAADDPEAESDGGKKDEERRSPKNQETRPASLHALVDAKKHEGDKLVVVAAAMTREAMFAHKLDSEKMLQSMEKELADRGLRVILLVRTSTLPTWGQSRRIWEYRAYLHHNEEGDSEESLTQRERECKFKSYFTETIQAQCSSDVRLWQALLRNTFASRELGWLRGENEAWDVALSRDLDSLIRQERIKDVIPAIQDRVKQDECWRRYQRAFGVEDKFADFGDSSLKAVTQRLVSIDAARVIASDHLPPITYGVFRHQITKYLWGKTSLEICNKVRLLSHDLQKAVEQRENPITEEKAKEQYDALSPLAQMVHVIATMCPGLTVRDFRDLVLKLASRFQWYRCAENERIELEQPVGDTSAVELDVDDLWRLHGDAAIRACGLSVIIKSRHGLGYARVIVESVEAQSFDWREKLEDWSPMLVQELLSVLYSVDYLLFDMSEGLFDSALALFEQESRYDTVFVDVLISIVASCLAVRTEPNLWYRILQEEWRQACRRCAQLLATLVPALLGSLGESPSSDRAAKELGKLLKRIVNRESAVRILQVTIDLSDMGFEISDFDFLDHIRNNGGKDIWPVIAHVVSMKCRHSFDVERAWKGVDLWLEQLNPEDNYRARFLVDICCDVLSHSYYIRSTKASGKRDREIACEAPEVHAWMSKVLSQCAPGMDPKFIPAPLRWLFTDQLVSTYDDGFFKNHAISAISSVTPLGVGRERFVESVVEEATAYLDNQRRSGALDRATIWRELYVAALSTIWEWRADQNDASRSAFLDAVLEHARQEERARSRLGATLGELDRALVTLWQFVDLEPDVPEQTDPTDLTDPEAIRAAITRLRASIANWHKEETKVNDE